MLLMPAILKCKGHEFEDSSTKKYYIEKAKLCEIGI
jgi:hypothetical protein